MGKNLREMLNKVQSKFLRMGAGCLRSTRNEVINMVTRNTPLDLYVEEIALRARIRTRPLLKDTWDGLPIKGNELKGHRSILDKAGNGLGNPEKPPRYDHSWTEWDEPNEEEIRLKIYTDGASDETGSGYAFAAYDNLERNPVYTESKRLEGACPYQAELYAIKAALTWLRSNPQRLKEWGTVSILSDSKSGVLSLRSTSICNTKEEKVSATG